MPPGFGVWDNAGDLGRHGVHILGGLQSTARISAEST